jgi:hypothetical protein
MRDHVIRVDNEDALAKLANARRWPITKPGHRLALTLPQEPALRAWWEARLNRAYSDCGCGAGAIVALVSTVLFVAAVRLGLLLERQPTSTHVWASCAVFVGSAILGKAAGRFRAQQEFRRVVSEFRNALSRAADAMTSPRHTGIELQ